jgi:ribosomal protein S18 acetylase RimI-like enzyme
MASLTVDIRSAECRDAAGISAVHDEAWTLAYAGIIPAMHLARMVQRRGPAWWDGMLGRARGGVLVVSVGETVAGYATLGAARKVAGLAFDGEVFELYVKPEYQGLGFGTRLFKAARERLTAAGRRRLVVWALNDNEPAVAFYRRRGGRPVARDQERFGATALPKTAFSFAQA